jgi:NAD(P)-dependent dehydrogenase (short-subunit alcohol dehydrogenase family)
MIGPPLAGHTTNDNGKDGTSMSIRFDDRVALVTGAGGGIGKYYALELARRGAKVVVNDLGGAVDGTGGSTSMAQAVVDEITAAGGQAVANGDSVSDRAGADSMVKAAVDSFGSIDIVINNAGILRDKTFIKMELDDFAAVVDVHLMGSVYVTKAAFPRMKEKGYGRIVMTSSTSGLFGNFGQTNYGAAKMGVVGFMNCLALEGAKYDVKVNTIAPAAATRMTDGLLPPEAVEAMKPELVAPAVLYLVSDDAPTGQIFFGAGGYFTRIALLQGAGVVLGPAATVDDFSARYAEISDMSGAQPVENAGDSTMKLFTALMEAAGKST